jgi:hypothetical protein
MRRRFALGFRLLMCSALVAFAAAESFGQTSFLAEHWNEQSEQAIEAALQRRGSVVFQQMPLLDVAASLGEQFGVQVVLAGKKLEEASVSAEAPITADLNGLTLESILRLVLKDLELCFVVRDEALLITTPEDAEALFSTRVYPVLDLVATSVPGARGEWKVAYDYYSLIELIKATIEPDSWDDVGGPGAIAELAHAGVLVTSQSRDVHRRIDGLLTTLRRAKTVQGLGPTWSSGRASTLWPGGQALRANEPGIEAWRQPRIYAAGP